MKFLDNLLKKIFESELWKSIYKTEFPATRRNRIKVILGSVVLHLHPPFIRKHELKISYTWCMGGITLFLFLIETITGVLLMYYYVPDVGRAYNDMKDLQFAVPFGILLRNIHRWAAHAMVITVFLHMLRVFLTGSYKPPRQFNWVVGVLLLVCTLMLSFTGYLLPWDQLAMWAITVGTNMARATPFLGHEGPFPLVHAGNDVRFALLGGRFVGENALIRFYVLHCIGFPLIATICMAIHFWRVRKDGFSGPPL